MAGLLLMVVVGGAMQRAEGGVAPGPLRVRLAAWAREVFGRVLILAITPLGWWTPDPRPRPGPTRHPPLLLVPGYGTNRAAFWFLCQYLAHRGWTWLWPVNHAGLERLLADQAAHLADRVQRLKRASGADRVDLLGFSMGGLVAAWYLHHLDGAAHVRRLVTVGTPWRGTRTAAWGRTPLAAQMRWQNPELLALDPGVVPTVSIWSPDDPVVVPARSAAVDGAESVQVDGAGHLDQILNGRVFRAIARALSQGDR